MGEKRFNDIIVELRKKRGMTQQELADKLNITDKAVSKWERGLSYPDITSISSLASALDVDSSYLIDLCKKEDSINPYAKKKDIKLIVNLICNSLGVAMSIAVVVLNVLGQIEVNDSLLLLGIGLFCVSLSVLSKTNENDNVKKGINKK